MEHDIDFIGFLEQSISEEEREKIQSHMAVCSECRREMEHLTESVKLLDRVFEKHPYSFCPQKEDLMRLAVGDADAACKGRILAHAKDCPVCLEKLAYFEKVVGEQIEDIQLGEMVPLPADLKEIIGPGQKPFRERLREALLALKSKGKNDISDVLQHVDELVERLSFGSSRPSHSFGLERDKVLPKQTDLELRLPHAPAEIQMELGKYSVSITSGPSGMRIRVTEGGKPVTELKVWIRKGAEKEQLARTNQNGEIVV
jgi:hypothetical protein